jgi:hypothetical protein
MGMGINGHGNQWGWETTGMGINGMGISGDGNRWDGSGIMNGKAFSCSFTIYIWGMSYLAEYGTWYRGMLGDNVQTRNGQSSV